MTSKRHLKGKLGHVVKMRVCLLTRLPWLITFQWERTLYTEMLIHTIVAENIMLNAGLAFACLCERNYFLALFVSIVSDRSYLKSTCSFCFFFVSL